MSKLNLRLIEEEPTDVSVQSAIKKLRKGAEHLRDEVEQAEPVDAAPDATEEASAPRHPLTSVVVDLTNRRSEISGKIKAKTKDRNKSKSDRAIVNKDHKQARRDLLERQRLELKKLDDDHEDMISEIDLRISDLTEEIDELADAHELVIEIANKADAQSKRGRKK